MNEPVVRRVLLVGFMGAGKTRVGGLLAERLGWRFADFDRVVEEEEGASVAEIFRTRGEEAFRRAEARAAARLLVEERVVLGSGGGWAAAGGRLDTLPEGTVSVWLRVSAAEAVRRVRTEGGRPLLDREDPLEFARELLDRRLPFYARATWAVDTEGRLPEDVCAEIEGLIRREPLAGGAPGSARGS